MRNISIGPPILINELQSIPRVFHDKVGKWLFCQTKSVVPKTRGRGAGCGVRGAGCGVRGAGCGVRGAGCGVSLKNRKMNINK